MADDSSKNSNGPSPFDVRIVKHLVGLMAQHDLSEIDLRDGAQRLRLRRGALHTTVATSFAPPHMAHVAAPTPTAAAAPASAPTPAAAPAAPAKNLLEIKSESVGTYYAKPNPESQPYVKVGSKVTPTTVVCQIEAMKLYNEVTAGVSGTIVEICVENGKSVEFNEVLFRVDPAG